MFSGTRRWPYTSLAPSPGRVACATVALLTDCTRHLASARHHKTGQDIVERDSARSRAKSVATCVPALPGDGRPVNFRIPQRC